MHKSNFILFTLLSVFLIGCASQVKPIKSDNEITTINPKVERAKANFFQNRQAHETFNVSDAKSYTIESHQDELVQARQTAYQTVLTNRLKNYSIKEYYLNENGVVFITTLSGIDTIRFREFIRSGFCPLVVDLAQGFGNNRRVIMLDEYKRQGRYFDYSYDFCEQISKMTVLDANRVILPKIMAY